MSSAFPVSECRLNREYRYADYVRLQERLRRRRRELLIFCTHAPALTAGVQAKDSSLRVNRAAIGSEIPILKIGRGGDFTAHEPGQCVIYPHVDLRRRRLPIGGFFRGLLDVTRESLRAVWSIDTVSYAHAPGLYCAQGGRKIASIGVMFKGFFTSFGVAVNVSNDLKVFDLIHPCGHPSVQMTSVKIEGGDPGRLEVFAREWTERFSDQLPGIAEHAVRGQT